MSSIYRYNTQSSLPNKPRLQTEDEVAMNLHLNMSFALSSLATSSFG